MKLQDRKGWVPTDGLPEADTITAERAMEVASLFRQTFTTDAGERVLDRLVMATLMQPIVKPHYTQFEAGIREGKADLVRQILAQIEFAKGSK